ncbi:hypothetical protein BV20DRAFT_932980, partial [Pilatotrama ljubarskyi]
RKTEFRGLVRSLSQDAFGEHLKDMYDLQMLATAPEAQGQGYGSALVTGVTDMADAEGRDVWVISGDAYKFYERLGFVVVRKAVLGGDNPDWHEEPIPVYVVSSLAASRAFPCVS